MQLADMAKAAAASDAETVRRGAHSLKSNARDLGATEFAQLCAALEIELHTPGFAGDLSARVENIASHWPEVLAALEAELIGSES